MYLLEKLKRPEGSRQSFQMRWQVVGLASMLLVLAVIYWQFEPTDSGSCDTGVYLSGAQSLAEGRGYRFVAYANEPAIGLYPPAQAAFLSLFWRIDPQFPENVSTMYWGMIVLALGVVALLCAYWHREGMTPFAIGLLALSWGTSPIWCWQLGIFLSDVLFVLLWLCVAWAWQRATDWDQPQRWFVTGLLIALMYLTRTAALAPLAALMALTGWRALRGKWRPLGVFLPPTLATVIFWKLFSSSNTTYGAVFEARWMDEGGWSGMLGYWGGQFIYYASGAHFLNGLFPWLMQIPAIPGWPAWALNVTTAVLMVCGWIFAGLCVYGWKLSKGISDRLLGAMVLAFLVEHALWPFEIGGKAVFSVLPFMLVWAWRGLNALRQAHVLKWSYYVVPAFIATSTIGNLQMLPDKIVEFNRHNRLEELSEIGYWVRQHTPTNACIAVSWTHPVLHFHHYSSRKVVQDEMDPLFEQVVRPAPQKPDYLLCSQHKPLKEDAAGQFQLVKQSYNGFYRLYRFVPDSGVAAVSDLPVTSK